MRAAVAHGHRTLTPLHLLHALTTTRGPVADTPLAHGLDTATTRALLAYEGGSA